MSSNDLVVLASGKSLGRKEFVIGKIQIGRFICPENLSIEFESDSEKEAAQFIINNFSQYSRSSTITAVNESIREIWTS
jgi:hypothetical protein